MVKRRSDGRLAAKRRRPVGGRSLARESLRWVAVALCVSVGAGLANTGARQGAYATTLRAAQPSLIGAELGYWLVGADGSVYPSSALRLGSVVGQSVVAAAAAPGGVGYWLASSAGGVFSFGAAHYFGSMGAKHLNTPIVGMAATPPGGGYWLVSSGGGVFSFGGAHYFGSMGARHLGTPIVGMAAAPGGRGYWLVASGGGVFNFGATRYLGSLGGKRLSFPIVGMAVTPDGRGYWLVSSNGGVFSFGDARFYGSAESVKARVSVAAMATTPDGKGYWLVTRSGKVLSFGDAPHLGSAPTHVVPGPGDMVAMAVSLSVPSASTICQPPPPPPTTTTSRPTTTTSRRTTTTRPTATSSSTTSSSTTSSSTTSSSTTSTTSSAAPSSTTSSTASATSSTTTSTTSSLPTSSTTSTTSSTTSSSTTSSTTTSSSTTSTLPVPTTSPTTTSTPPTTVPPKTPNCLSPPPAGTTGFDVSWPQCSPGNPSQARSLPSDPSFAVVGVNNGNIDGFNSCFVAEASWAGPNLSVYIILQPAPGGDPPQEASGPRASCSRTSSVCEGYDWGYNYANDDLAFVASQGFVAHAWWLDIETGEGWPTLASLQPVNAAIIQGALDAIKADGQLGGIYSTWYQWGQITGSYLPHSIPPIWVPGAEDASGNSYSAASYCQRALEPGDPSDIYSPYIGFANGVPWLVQYGYEASSGPVSIDPDYSCG